MRLRHIEIFEAIRRTGSLTEAAAALHISQPAASKLLAHAEAQLGFKLFERVKGRLVATREAEILAPEVARASRDAQPGITFDIHTHHSAELVQGLLAHELDLAITFDANDHPGLTRTSLGHTELVHLSRRPGAGTTRLQELGDETLIVLDARDASGSLLQMALDAQGLAPRVAIQVQTHYVACALAEAGCGDAVVDAITARAMLRPGMALRRLEPALRVPISVMTRSQDALSTLHHDFIERLRQACSVLQAQPAPQSE